MRQFNALVNLVASPPDQQIVVAYILRDMQEQKIVCVTYEKFWELAKADKVDGLFLYPSIPVSEGELNYWMSYYELK